jgi:hypothetical protein
MSDVHQADTNGGRGLIGRLRLRPGAQAQKMPWRCTDAGEVSQPEANPASALSSRRGA